MKRKISTALRILVSAGLVGILLWSVRDQLPNILNTLRRTDIALFSLAVLIFIINNVILAVRLQLLLVGEGLRIPFIRVVELSFIGYFFNNFTPTAVGGDIVKAYYVHKHTKKTAKSFIAIFMDRFIGLLTFILIAVSALFFSWSNVQANLKSAIFIFAIGGTLVCVAILNVRIAKFMTGLLSKFRAWNIGEKISKIYSAVHEYRNKKNLMFLVALVSVISQSVYFVIIYFFAKALHTNLLLITIFLTMPIVCLISMIPSIGGLGVREGAMVIFFGPIIGSDNAFSLSILQLAMLLVISLIGGIIYLSAPQFKMQKKDIAEIDKYSV